MKRYVALGSSMAAGPGIKPPAPGAPWQAGRSARNYPHLVAARLGLDLTDVTYSGATTAHVLRDHQNGAPPQIDALDGSEALVTVTIGGNDAGYVPQLMAAALPRFTRSLPLVGPFLRGLLDPDARATALTEVADALVEVGREIRRRAPQAQVLFVDYLTLLPPEGVAASPPVGGRRDARAAHRGHAGTSYRRGRCAGGLRLGTRCAGECGAPCLVRPAMDHPARAALAEPACAAAPECGGHACGGRSGGGASAHRRVNS